MVGLVIEDLAEQIVCPLFVALRDGSMPLDKMKYISSRSKRCQPGLLTRYNKLNSTLTWFPSPRGTTCPFLSVIGYIVKAVS